MKISGLVLLAVGLLTLRQQPTVVVHGTRVSVWNAKVDSTLLKRMWLWDSTCAMLKPLPKHDWRNVTWLGANLLEAGSDPKAQVDTSLGIGPDVIGYWEGDSIFLDTGVVKHARPWFMHNLLAHELLHQLLQFRHPVDSTLPALIQSPVDSAHPVYPFLYPCRLMNIEIPVVDSEGLHDP